MDVKTALIDGVLSLELARPSKKNALTGAMYLALAQALRSAVADDQVRSVLLTGQPDVFTAGHDVEDFMAHAGSLENAPVLAFMQALLDCDKPVIAAVNGAAIGIGTTLLLHCDFVFVADDARLAMPFVALGLVPEFGSSLLFAQQAGLRRAAENLLLGDPFSAADAVEYGIANAVLPAAEVLPHARRVAQRFNQLPPGAVRDSKRLMRRAGAEETRRAIAAENEVFSRRLSGAEAREAMSAFLARRPAGAP